MVPLEESFPLSLTSLLLSIATLCDAALESGDPLCRITDASNVQLLAVGAVCVAANARVGALWKLLCNHSTQDRGEHGQFEAQHDETVVPALSESEGMYGEV